MAQCLFLTLLPAELRLRIYEHVLAFEKPLKLRQIVAGSKNTGILRANRQIYDEALPVFYDLNTIVATRNDFCKETGLDLQTPICRDQVRHLLVNNISQSIRCSSYSGGNNMYLAGCCDVCKPDTSGFISTLAALPRIRSVKIDYHHHKPEFQFMRKIIRRGPRGTGGNSQYALRCIGMTKYQLTSPSIPEHLSIVFVDLPFNTIWNELTKRKMEIRFDIESHPSSFIPVPPWPLLNRLRDEIDKRLTENIYYYLVWTEFGARTGGLPPGSEHVISTLQDPGADSETLEACAEEVLDMIRQVSAQGEMVRQFLAKYAKQQ